MKWDNEGHGEFLYRPAVPSMYNTRIHPYTEEAYLEALASSLVEKAYQKAVSDLRDKELSPTSEGQ